ncbi:MAG: acyl-CoA dehydrogenase [Planctomycetota bacterium]|jgi:acyl-CoA dehydrogenase|nr:acyl-CoA dehydrogenase [Planctomycetota bacterium]MDP6763184.1 acyl-CoA dehydrogenase [Planctomycetota bacterium]MDP6989832.1 acyl-CoA dehydrogenase [Planctomycetota bacterium]
MITPTLIALLGLSLVLLHFGRALLAWTLPPLVGIALWALAGIEASGWFWTLAGLYGLCVVVFAVPLTRRMLLSRRLMKLLAPIFPTMSETERIALEAGTVWWDADLFGGRPRWKRLVDFQVSELNALEREFLDGPTEELCRMLNDWEIHQRRDLSAETWDFMKKAGFFGMIIPTDYGGLGLSAQACSAVLTKISTRSVPGAVTVMVPNSLGPAELLLHYGTEEQKDHFLPRLASGEEMPCFALTEPGAGSDAGSMQSSGVVCRGIYQGEETLGIRLNWDKRYITLSSVATVLGLAFKLRDPDGLLGGEEDRGITCALVPTDTPGVEIGMRHDPLGVPFINGPTKGHDVFVPIDAIIGGAERAGHGWRMLMDCLSAGRGISLPGMACGAAQGVARGLSAYGNIREQFGMPIGRFEGVEEKLAPIGGMGYLMNAARTLTAGAIDAGQKPAVISAIMKAYLTDGMRRVVIDGMDVLGGAGISLGPKNTLGLGYQGLPISITVEGANILTRSMIIFGQGAIRCHPFALDEIQSVQAKDVKRFDEAFFGHIGHVFSNATRATVLGWSRALLGSSPVDGPAAEYFRGLDRMSAAYAMCSEVAMMTLGGSLKFREKLTGRLADGLAWLYLGSAALKRFEDGGRSEVEVPFMRWSLQTALFEIQTALLGVLDNLPNRPIAHVLRLQLFPIFSRHRGPSDRLESQLSRAMLSNAQAREMLSRELFMPDEDEPGLGALEKALHIVLAASDARKKLKEGVRDKVVVGPTKQARLDAAVEVGVLTAAERDLIRLAAETRDEAIQVDAFEFPGYPLRVVPPEAAPAEAAPAASEPEPESTGVDAG